MFKILSKNKSTIRKYYVFKEWSFNQSSISSRNIVAQSGVSGNGTFYTTTEATNSDGSYKRLIYNSINKLYYQNISNLYKNNLSESLHYTHGNIDQLIYSTRSIDTQVEVLNIPKTVFGEKIKLNSVTITSNSINYTDDGNYNLKTPSGYTIGNVFYETGHIVITSGSYLNTFTDFDITFKSTQKISEFEAICDIKANEFNYTSNVSAMDDSGSYIPILSSSVTTPFITKIGLYNDDNDLLIEAKTPRPIQKDNKMDMSFVIRLDL